MDMNSPVTKMIHFHSTWSTRVIFAHKKHFQLRQFIGNIVYKETFFKKWINLEFLKEPTWKIIFGILHIIRLSVEFKVGLEGCWLNTNNFEYNIRVGQQIRNEYSSYFKPLYQTFNVLTKLRMERDSGKKRTNKTRRWRWVMIFFWIRCKHSIFQGAVEERWRRKKVLHNNRHLIPHRILLSLFFLKNGTTIRSLIMFHHCQLTHYFRDISCGKR